MCKHSYKCGDVVYYGAGQYRVYNEFGFILCDTRAEIEEELERIKNLKKGGENGSENEGKS